MDYDWLYERLSPLYCLANGRNGTDPRPCGSGKNGASSARVRDSFAASNPPADHGHAVLPLVFGVWSVGQHPYFATVSYAFCKRFPPELASEIFEHILNKALNNRAVDPDMIFIDGTHIKASANKKKFQKERVAKVYSEELRREVNAEREVLGVEAIPAAHLAGAPRYLVEQLCKTERGKEIYAMRKKTIERVFGDAKEKHAMRSTTEVFSR